MSVHLTSFCFFILALQVRNSCPDKAPRLYGVSGENTLFPCIFHSSGTLKSFCRETCEGANVLIRTTNNTAQNGRYRTEYVREASNTYPVLSVSISELTWSDSGPYRCGLDDSSSSASYQDFSLVVVDALLDLKKDRHFYKEPGSSLKVACSFKYSGRKQQFCRGECGKEEVLVQTDGVRAERGRYSIEYDEEEKSGGVLLVTITQLTQSDSGRYRCMMDRTTGLFRAFSITVAAGDPSSSTPTTTQSFTSSSNVPLIVGVTLVVVVILISAALLVSCRRRSVRDVENGRKSSGSNIEKATLDNNSTLKGSAYQNLSSATRDQNQVYCTLGELK